jgi:hypothetical protein
MLFNFLAREGKGWEWEWGGGGGGNNWFYNSPDFLTDSPFQD